MAIFYLPFASMLPGYKYIWNGGGCSSLESLIFLLVIVGLSSWFYLRYHFQQCVYIHLLDWRIIIADLEFVYAHFILPILAVARSKAWVGGHSLAGIVVSNPAGTWMPVPLWLFCFVSYRFLRWADHSFRGVLANVECLCVIAKPKEWGGLGPVGRSSH
jgi:hypothetical protein